MTLRLLGLLSPPECDSEICHSLLFLGRDPADRRGKEVPDLGHGDSDLRRSNTLKKGAVDP
ncbi:uncharacterized protein N7498_007157 [Penicillium cinerascens]|uniref:Uncharacterized protein n=1 Tax=Penicillium cinerascens TaxID=70096 RepID=A0A9W9MD40_9EURO|nr:uncharacterized protein N7498_007157 [Penicillium cinerascens]KAJ5198040.1 hypothetical protein N7498_007157 [Penicillium cinerascens]